MCVYYQKLNEITKHFEFPIPCCGDSIRSVGAESDTFFIISLDTCQGYHQVQVRKIDKENPAYLPQIKKYCFCVMQFGPTNLPGFYSDTMRNFKEEWYLLLNQTLCSIDTLGNNSVSVTETDEIYPNKTKLVSGSRTIIDDIILFCSNLDAILIYLECVCKVFSNIESASDLTNVNLSKLDLNMSAMTSPKKGTATLNQKSNFINDWILPLTRKYLF